MSARRRRFIILNELPVERLQVASFKKGVGSGGREAVGAVAPHLLTKRGMPPQLFQTYVFRNVGLGSIGMLQCCHTAYNHA